MSATFGGYLFRLAIAVDLIALGASGAGLTLNYRPEPALARPDVSQPGGGILADVHFVAAAVAVVLLAAVAAILARRAFKRDRVTALVVLSALVVAVLAGALAFVSGERLPWSFLGISAVNAPVRGLRGVWRAAFDPFVRFVIVGGRELEQGDYRRLVLAHLVAAPAVLAAALGLAWWRVRRSDPAPP